MAPVTSPTARKASARGTTKRASKTSSRVVAHEKKARARAVEARAKLRDYFAALPAANRRHLKTLATALHAAAPSAEPGFGYGIPALAIDGRILLYYAAWQTHSAVYPISQATERQLAAELAGYPTSGKGTVRFPHARPIPVALVKKIVKARLAERATP
jgi:uncharacterized protein YdhG (YjbR/CyaY superfamily)